MVEAALVAEQLGRRVAPVPLIEGIVASRLLASVDAPPRPRRDIVSGARSPPSPCTRSRAGERQLVPAGAIADVVVGLEATSSCAFAADDAAGRRLANLASAPLAWRTLSGSGTRTVLADGADARARFDVAVREWKVLMAAAQTGVAQGALDLAIEYAKEREAFGVPIGAFQAISHAIVDVAVGVEGSRQPGAAGGVVLRPRAGGRDRTGARRLPPRARRGEPRRERGHPRAGWLRVHARIRSAAVLPARQGVDGRERRRPRTTCARSATSATARSEPV